MNVDGWDEEMSYQKRNVHLLNNLELVYYKRPDDFKLGYVNLGKYKNLEEILVETVDIDNALREIGFKL